jgi:GntR family transcriptional repressor for pyruvate dehydrogenase complex
MADADAKAAGALQVQRVRRASDQVSAQLRELILSGRLEPGTRFPAEQALATQFGVSRSTIREALQALSTEGLTRTKKGVHGGTFVTMPSADEVSDALTFGVTLLSKSNNVTVDELLEARELLEIPATRLAAARSTEEDLERLNASIPRRPLDLTVTEQFVQNRGFHRTIVEASHNTFLSIAAQPVFEVLQTRLQRSALGPNFHETINDHHREIADAIADRDGERAQRLMQSHLEWLRPQHERVWRAGADGEPGPPSAD